MCKKGTWDTPFQSAFHKGQYFKKMSADVLPPPQRCGRMIHTSYFWQLVIDRRTFSSFSAFLFSCRSESGPGSLLLYYRLTLHLLWYWWYIAHSVSSEASSGLASVKTSISLSWVSPNTNCLRDNAKLRSILFCKDEEAYFSFSSFSFHTFKFWGWENFATDKRKFNNIQG